MSKNRITIEAAKTYLEYHNQAGDNIYGELAYIGSTDRNRFLLWNTGSSVLEIQSDQWSRINPNPMALFNSLQFLQPGQVKISDICETTYPNLLNQEGNSNPAAVIRLAVMCMNKDGKPEGMLFIGIDVVHLRNVLSLYNSAKSPLHAFPQSPGLQSSYLFDMQGWMLFQSEDMEDPNIQLSTSRIRKGLTGRLGKSDFEGAFLPDAKNQIYWKMVSDVRSGNHSLFETDQNGMKPLILGDRYSLVYAPIPFRSHMGSEPEIIFGLAYLDRSRLKLPELMQPRSFFFMVMISVVVGMALALRILSVIVSKPIGNKNSPVSDTGILKPVHGADTLYLKLKESIRGNTIDPNPENSASTSGGDSRATAMEAAETIPIRNLFVEAQADMVEASSPDMEDTQSQSAGNGRMQGLPDGLSKRQQIIFPVILEKGGITRQEYLELLGDGVTARTAQYDLDIMVKKGYLKKNGKGQSAQYHPAVASGLF